ncbi:MAG TPA: hypothetical protein VGD76_20005 [Ramlibacter sp.]
MLQPVTFRLLAFVACGWLLACEVSALTLGRARGAALIGRPLELVIPVTLDPSDTQGPCAGADLFYGEERVRAPIVRWEPGIGTHGLLRVTSTVPVDEPMVTLYLRAGCGESASRRFVLLAEPPPEVEPVAGSAPPAVQRARPAPVRAVRRVSMAGQPRLRLEPLDLPIELAPTLRITSELRTQLAADPRERQAAAALWHVLQKGPDPTAQQALRLQAAERELVSLRDRNRRDAAALVEMRGQVERARAGRNTASLLVLALAAVLVGLLAWLALRWHRARRLERVGRWFEVHGEAALRNEAPTVPGPAAAAFGVPAATGASRTRVTTAPSPLAAAGGRSASLRTVGIQELIDVHDKAGFFLSIGETEQAISLLDSHVHGPVETGALAWLELLELHHSLGRRADYERLRGELSQRFAAQVPDFEHFVPPGGTLENHGRALGRIVALWPSREVLDLIEEALLRKPGSVDAEAFSLDACRELVLLYHVAAEMALPKQQAAPAADETVPGFTETSLQPLHALRPAPALSERERLMVPPASPRLGVDIELEDLPAGSAGPSALDFDVSAYDDVAGIPAVEPPGKRG